MLELQRDFSALLRQPAFFECIGKLILLSNSHQELRLREQWLDPQAVLFPGSSERSAIHVRSDVLFTRSFVGASTYRMLSISGKRTAMTSCKLLLACVAVIDNQEETTLDETRRLREVTLRDQRHFDALPWLGMYAVAVKKFQFFG